MLMEQGISLHCPNLAGSRIQPGPRGYGLVKSTITSYGLLCVSARLRIFVLGNNGELKLVYRKLAKRKLAKRNLAKQQLTKKYLLPAIPTREVWFSSLMWFEDFRFG